MMPVDPRPKAGPIADAPNVRYVVVAEHQEGVRPLPAFIVSGTHVVSRWVLTEDERREIAEGGDIWLSVITGGRPLQPFAMKTRIEDLFE